VAAQPLARVDSVDFVVYTIKLRVTGKCACHPSPSPDPERLDWTLAKHTTLFKQKPILGIILVPFRHDCSIDFINVAIFLVVALGRQPVRRRSAAPGGTMDGRGAGEIGLCCVDKGPSLVRIAIDVVDVVLRGEDRRSLSRAEYSEALGCLI